MYHKWLCATHLKPVYTFGKISRESRDTCDNQHVKGFTYFIGDEFTESPEDKKSLYYKMIAPQTEIIQGMFDTNLQLDTKQVSCKSVIIYIF